MGYNRPPIPTDATLRPIFLQKLYTHEATKQLGGCHMKAAPRISGFGADSGKKWKNRANFFFSPPSFSQLSPNFNKFYANYARGSSFAVTR